jgi:antitoxin CptB
MHRKISRLSHDETRRRRILFRATHRGTYENDLIIGGFVRARLDRLTDSELDEIERVMDLPEPLLADWLTGRRPIPPESDCLILRAMRQAALEGQARP